ncbi:hypothetical protein [Aliamphritea spongicola]|uniref:hypothetical protein n=1 Tax=Aliamphritea spongicola TaxID=707589 RepID=UPI00196A9707|nr:hypothetical protein [Aliamphritea spongicola]MBN3562998.1 hypothetical protein [Aliamphritea spongicola]
MRTTAIILFTLLLSACSNEEIYTQIQEGNRWDCRDLPTTAMKDCLRENNLPYDVYESTRKQK